MFPIQAVHPLRETLNTRTFPFLTFSYLIDLLINPVLAWLSVLTGYKLHLAVTEQTQQTYYQWFIGKTLEFDDTVLRLKVTPPPAL